MEKSTPQMAQKSLYEEKREKPENTLYSRTRPAKNFIRVFPGTCK